MNEIKGDVDPELVLEALVRRIRDASRYSGVQEAWEALLKVEQMSGQMSPPTLREGISCGRIGDAAGGQTR